MAERKLTTGVTRRIHQQMQVTNRERELEGAEHASEENWAVLGPAVFRMGELRLGFGGKVAMRATTTTCLAESEVRAGSMLTFRPCADGGHPVRGIVVEAKQYSLEMETEAGVHMLKNPAWDWKITMYTLKEMLRVAKSQDAGGLFDRQLLEAVMDPAPEQPREIDARCQESKWFADTGLSLGQRRAVVHVLSAARVGLICGPPGTGKTRTLVETIRQLGTRGRRVLVCSSSNVAVDNILAGLAPHGLGCLRLGNSAKAKPALRKWFLDQQVKRTEPGEWRGAVLSNMSAALERAKRVAPDWDKFSARMDFLRTQVHRLGGESSSEIIADASIVLCTLSCAGGPLLMQESFDVLVLDEANQTSLAEACLALAHCKKAILAGDCHQLAPASKAKGGQPSMLDGLAEFYPPAALVTQYRMNSEIWGFASECLYRGSLAHESIGAQRMHHLPHVAPSAATSLPLVFIDTAGFGFAEERVGRSKRNPGEATLALKHLASLVDANIQSGDVAILATYDGQVELIRAMAGGLPLSVSSVDGFQGQERDAIILSLVRSNPLRQIGEMENYRRLNVAITRARRHLCVIGDSDTLMNFRSSHQSFLAELGRHLAQNAEVCTPVEYL